MILQQLGQYRAGPAFSTPRMPWTGYSAVDRARGLQGLGDIDVTSMNLDDITNLVRQGLVVFNSQRVFDMNLERAALGLPPIPVSLAAPTVNVGLNADTQKLVLYGALALGAVMLLGKNR